MKKEQKDYMVKWFKLIFTEDEFNSAKKKPLCKTESTLLPSVVVPKTSVSVHSLESKIEKKSYMWEWKEFVGLYANGGELSSYEKFYIFKGNDYQKIKFVSESN